MSFSVVTVYQSDRTGQSSFFFFFMMLRRYKASVVSKAAASVITAEIAGQVPKVSCDKKDRKCAHSSVNIRGRTVSIVASDKSAPFQATLHGQNYMATLPLRPYVNHQTSHSKWALICCFNSLLGNLPTYFPNLAVIKNRLKVNVPVHPKGVGQGWGQGSV